MKVKLYKDKKWIYKEYILKERSINDLANECKASYNCVSDWINKHGFRKEKVKKIESYKDKNWLSNEYTIKRKTVCDIAHECKVTYLCIYYWLKKFNIPANTIMKRWTPKEIKVLVDSYISNKDLKDLTESLGRSRESIYSKALQLGLCSSLSHKNPCERKVSIDKKINKWSKVEESFLIYSKYTLKEMSLLLKRSEKAIYKKISRMKGKYI